MTALPESDRHDNYWLGRKDALADAAALKSYEGGWLAFLGHEAGFLFDGPVLRRFSTPGEALEAIRRRR